MASVAALLGLLALGVGTVWWSMNHYLEQVPRISDAFPHVRETERPVKPESAAGALNILIAGVDSRSDLPTTGDESKTDPQGRRQPNVVHATPPLAAKSGDKKPPCGGSDHGLPPLISCDLNAASSMPV